MPSKIATLGVERGNSATYFRKAAQLCEAAGNAHARGHFDAALILAIHAGISASDAVCIGVGTRKNKDAHERAPDLLEEVGGHATAFEVAAKWLRQLLAQKNRIEYENKRATERDAELGRRRCGNLVTWAKGVLEDARLL